MIQLQSIRSFFLTHGCLRKSQQPMLHYWKTHPEAANLPPERILELHLAVSEVLIPPLVAVVANHIETNTPIVLEGDYIVPALIQRRHTIRPGAHHVSLLG